MSYRNAEGYYDPTAGGALARVARTERKEKQNGRIYRPLVYVCSPFAGDRIRNIQAAQKYCKFAVQKGYIPLASHLFFPQFLDDEVPEERGLGLFFGKVFMDMCDEVWIFGKYYSDGMSMEHKRALRKGMRVRYFDTDCREIMDGGSVDGSV